MIPIVVTPPPPPPSPQAEELAELLTLSIQEFQRRRPETGAGDIRTALRLAAQRAAPGPRVAVVMGMVFLMVGLLFGLAMFLVVRQQQSASQIMPIAIGVGVLGAILGILAVTKRMR